MKWKEKKPKNQTKRGNQPQTRKDSRLKQKPEQWAALGNCKFRGDLFIYVLSGKNPMFGAKGIQQSKKSMNPDQTGQGIKSSPDSEAIGSLTE